MKIRGLGAQYERPEDEMWKDGFIDLQDIIRDENLVDNDELLKNNNLDVSRITQPADK